MTQRHDLDRMLMAWLDDPYTPPAPHYLGQVLEQTRRTRQRPAWANLERWIPMADRIPRPATAGPMRLAWFTVVALLVIALAAGAALVGSRLLQSPNEGVDSSVAIPQGAAAVLAYGSFVGGAGEPDAGDIYLVRADGTDLRQLTSGAGAESFPAFSPDGTRIAYRVWQGGNESVMVMDAGGGNRTTLATTSSSSSGCSRGAIAWSPDATSLIYPTSPVCDTTFDLFIVAPDGSSPATRLLAPGLDSAYAAWSPDGRSIAILGSEAGSVGHYIIDVGSGSALRGGLQARRILPGLGPLNNSHAGPSWSPDGSELAAVSETNDIVILKVDGSGQRVVASGGFNPTWSPDGRQLAFYRMVDPSEYFQGRPCTVRTWIVGADGTDEHRLEQLGDGCGPGPLWSPDGTRVAGMSIGTSPDDSTVGFHAGIVPVDGSSPVVMLPDGVVGSWQPVAAPLPAPSAPPASSAAP